jgi:hypothetical protein
MLTFLKQSIGNYDDIIPRDDNKYTLGNSLKRWKSIYIGEGTLYITDAVRNTEVALTVNDGVFFINGIAQAQLENIKTTNLRFQDGSLQTTAYIPSSDPVSENYNPNFKSADNLSAGIVSTGSYIMISQKICSFRARIDFSGMTNAGSSSQYQIDLPFNSVAVIRQPNGLLHQTSGNSFYHIAGTTDTPNTKILKLFYFPSQTDLPWKSSTPVGATTTTSHFDISGIYEIP